MTHIAARLGAQGFQHTGTFHILYLPTDQVFCRPDLAVGTFSAFKLLPVIVSFNRVGSSVTIGQPCLMSRLHTFVSFVTFQNTVFCLQYPSIYSPPIHRPFSNQNRPFSVSLISSWQTPDCRKHSHPSDLSLLPR
jgi:hypothetical protein